MLAIVVLVAISIADVLLGSIYLELGEFFNFFTKGTTGSQAHDVIIKDIRLPKLFTGLLAGAGLSCAGLLMQTLFRNPLAGPFVLGISSGSSLGVALVVMSSIALVGHAPGKWLIILSSAAGASGIMLIVLGIAAKTRDNMSLLIVGLMIGALSSSVISILQYYSNARQIQVFLLWSFGNLNNLGWTELAWFTPIVIASVFATLVLSKTMNVFLLSENYARSMGVQIKFARLIFIGITALLTGVITAFCGPIAFIGIAVPHLSRILFGTSDHKVLIPAVCVIGAIILIFCDLISSGLLGSKVLPINAVTSLIGAPLVIWLIMTRNSIGKTFGSSQ